MLYSQSVLGVMSPHCYAVPAEICFCLFLCVECSTLTERMWGIEGKENRASTLAHYVGFHCALLLNWECNKNRTLILYSNAQNSHFCLREL